MAVIPEYSMTSVTSKARYAVRKMITVSVTAEVNRMYFRTSVQISATTIPMS